MFSNTSAVTTSVKRGVILAANFSNECVVNVQGINTHHGVMVPIQKNEVFVICVLG